MSANETITATATEPTAQVISGYPPMPESEKKDNITINIVNDNVNKSSNVNENTNTNTNINENTNCFGCFPGGVFYLDPGSNCYAHWCNGLTTGCFCFWEGGAICTLGFLATSNHCCKGYYYCSSAICSILGTGLCCLGSSLGQCGSCAKNSLGNLFPCFSCCKDSQMQ